MGLATRGIRFILLAAVLVFLCGGSNPALAAKPESEQPVAVAKAEPAKKQPASDAKSQRDQEAIRQVRIMAKVLEAQMFSSIVGRDLIVDDVFQSGGVRGFRIPNFGAVFLAHVRFPLAEGKAAVGEPPKPAEDNLWDRIDQKSRGFDVAWQESIRVTEEDRQKTNALQDVVVKTLAKYGGRLTTMQPNEKLIVLVGSSCPTDETGLWQFVDYGSSRNSPVQLGLALDQLPERLPTTSWILGITKANLADDPNELLKRAKVRRTQLGAKDEAKVVKQLTIMSRILEKSFESELSGEILTASMVQRGIQGFYIPDAGVVFFVEAKFPLAELAGDEKTTKKGSDDLWDIFDRGLEGGPAPIGRDARYRMYPKSPIGGEVPSSSFNLAPDTASASPAAAGDQAEPQAANPFSASIATASAVGTALDQEVDKEKIERLKSAILKVLARYGSRLEALSRDDERIIVVVSGARQPTSYDPYSALGPASNYYTYAAPGENWGAARRIVTVLGAEGAAAALGHGSVLIISVAKKDLVNNPEDLGKRAIIESYAGLPLGGLSSGVAVAVNAPQPAVQQSRTPRSSPAR